MIPHPRCPLPGRRSAPVLRRSKRTSAPEHKTNPSLPKTTLSRASRHAPTDLMRPLAIALFCFLWLTLSAPAAQPEVPLAASPPPPTPAPSDTTARTNDGPHFEVLAYEIRGDTLLSTETLMSILVKYTGTNISIADIKSAASDLQMEYRNRGFPTVSVTLPQQTISNGMVKIGVFEGRLAEIQVDKNRYFSSNNVMRSLPSLHTNIILSRDVFQAELDRANGNRDRQIYPELRPGPETNTTTLYLGVKDRLPMHGKIELNNQSTPDTPELRLNSSLVYNNLWQLEHSIGAQYSFSPEAYKQGSQWNFYDLPLIANYSAFYRLPLATPGSLSDQVSTHPGTFGYDEASRQFRLPPSSGLPELNLYASRSTIDTGVQNSTPQQLFSSDSQTIDKVDTHQDLTINEALGFRLSQPLPQIRNIRSGLSGGVDLKQYQITSYATNTFIFTEFLLDENNNPLPPRTSQTVHPIPSSYQSIGYLPLSLRWDGSSQDKSGTTDFGISYSPNLWFSGSASNLQSLAGSAHANGYWQVVGASLGRQQSLYKEWKLAVRLDGQWANEPLISNEQYAIGGLAGVRGYREGEVFGDAGWRITTDVKSPPVFAGMAFDKIPMTLRYSVFMDYGQAFLLDPQGRPPKTSLWGTGAGVTLSFGPHFDGRFAAALPLLATPNISVGQTRFYFALSAQF